MARTLPERRERPASGSHPEARPATLARKNCVDLFEVASRGAARADDLVGLAPSEGHELGREDRSRVAVPELLEQVQGRAPIDEQR